MKQILSYLYLRDRHTDIFPVVKVMDIKIKTTGLQQILFFLFIPEKGKLLMLKNKIPDDIPGQKYSIQKGKLTFKEFGKIGFSHVRP